MHCSTPVLHPIDQTITAETEIEVHSPAKLNLFLHITGRRENGYHDLQTIFDLIDLADVMRFRLNHTAHIQIEGCQTIDLQDNLIYKACQCLLPYRQSTDWGCDIQIEKHIPMGAGLGGGSSNAATTLLVLNQLWQCRLSLSQLLEFAVKLGADVPIFVYGQMAWAEGIGEQIQPIANHTAISPQQSYLIVKPDCHIVTADLFKNPQLKRDYPQYNLQDYLNQPELFDNCFENLVYQQFSEVKHTIDLLKRSFPQQTVRLTGTGSCVFVILPNDLAEQDIQQYITTIQQQTTAQIYFAQRQIQSDVAKRFGVG